MRPTVYTAREREETAIPIDEVLRDGRFDIFPQVQRKEYFEIRFKGDRLHVNAGKYVGLIPLNSRVFIEVEPKMPVANLIAILSAVNGEIAELSVLQKEYRAGPTSPPFVLEAIARAFVKALERLETEWLPKRYEPFWGSGSSLKGQVRFKESVQRFWSRGIRHAAVSTYFDLTADLPENRLLRYVCHLLRIHHRTTGTLSRSVASLAHFEEWLGRAGVALARPSLRDLPPWQEFPPSAARTIRLARLIVSGQGIELPAAGSDVELPSLLVDMEDMFEKYVRHVLRARLVGVQVLDGNAEGEKALFDDRSDPPANPDVVIQRRPGDWPLIVEAKYKKSETRDDIDQVLGYALAYRAPKIVIALPAEAGVAPGPTPVGRVQGIHVLRYCLDLAAADLDAEERQFGAAIQALIT